MLIVVAIMLGSVISMSMRRLGRQTASKVTRMVPTVSIFPREPSRDFGTAGVAQRGQHRLYGGGSGLYNVEGDVERRVYRWVLEVVYGMGLCPWSGSVLKKPGKGEAPRLQIKSDTEIDITRKGLKHFGTTMMKYCEELVVKKNGTVLLVCPTLEDFSDFMAVAEFADELLEQSGMDEQIQIATFHPDYLFEGEDEETSLTNQSPYPILHLLRVEDVKEAIESFEAEGKSTDEVWIRNKAFVEKQGDQIRLVLEKILSDI